VTLFCGEKQVLKLQTPFQYLVCPGNKIIDQLVRFFVANVFECLKPRMTFPDPNLGQNIYRVMRNRGMEPFAGVGLMAAKFLFCNRCLPLRNTRYESELVIYSAGREAVTKGYFLNKTLRDGILDFPAHLEDIRKRLTNLRTQNLSTVINVYTFNSIITASFITRSLPGRTVDPSVLFLISWASKIVCLFIENVIRC